MKIIMKKTLKILLCLLLFPVSQSLLAAPITNGNFDAGLTGWDIDGNTSLNGGQVELSTIGAGGTFSDASVFQGDFFSGAAPIQLGATDNFLNFDVGYQDLGVGGSSGSTLSDALIVSLLDELDFSGASDLFFDSEFDFLFGASFATVSLDVSSLAGNTIGLYFDVFNEDDGRNSLFTLDKIFFSETQPTTASVPEPGTLLLLLPGILFFSSRFKQSKSM